MTRKQLVDEVDERKKNALRGCIVWGILMAGIVVYIYTLANQ